MGTRFWAPWGFSPPRARDAGHWIAKRWDIDMLWDLETVVEEGLGGDYLEDRVTTRLGWVCCRNTDFKLGPKYLVAFNFPTEIDEIEYISQFIRSAHRETVWRFYRCCNGMNIFGNRFSVPGVRFSSDENSGLDFFNIPYDFQVTGGILLPPHAPTDGFLIGTGHMPGDGGQTRELYDILDARGQILSGFFDESGEVVASFQRIEPWLAARVDGARRNFLAARRARMI